MIKLKKFSFAVEVDCVWDKTRFKDSAFLCNVIQGEIHKGDVVQFLDGDGLLIVEEAIHSIDYAGRCVDSVKKGDAEDDKVLLNFKHIWEYPINAAKYIVKMDERSLLKARHAPRIPLPINNELPYDRLITRSVGLNEFIEKLYVYPLSTNLGYYLYDVHKAIGIECLRETEQGNLYSVHKVSEGGLLYIFYARIAHPAYMKVTGWYYVRKRVASSDFEQIKKGSAFKDVVDIDPAAVVYENIYNSNAFLFNLKAVGLDTYHFMSDGVLKLHFVLKESEGGGNLEVTKKTIVDFDDIASIQEGERICSLSGRILPMDIIDQ